MRQFRQRYELLVRTSGRDAVFSKDGVTPSITLRVRPVKYKADEMLAGNLTDHDLKLYLMRGELEAAGIAPPAPQDYFTIDGVKKMVTEPAEPLYWFNQEHVGYRVNVRG